MIDDVVLQSLHVKVNCIEEGGKASGRNSKTCRLNLVKVTVKIRRAFRAVIVSNDGTPISLQFEI